MHVREALGGVGEFPVAVGQGFRRLFDVIDLGGAGEFLVEPKARRDVGNVVGGKERRGVEIDVGRTRQGRLEVGRFAPLQGLHGFLQHAVV